MPRTARRKGKRTRRLRKRRRRAPAATGPAGVLRDMNTYRSRLVAERDAIDQRISALDSAIAVMGAAGRVGAAARGPRRGRAVGGAPARRGRRAGVGGVRPGSLKDHILQVLRSSGGVMSVKDITAGVVGSGYQSRNKTLAKSVGIALTQLPEVRKVRRGRFRLK